MNTALVCLLLIALGCACDWIRRLYRDLAASRGEAAHWGKRYSEMCKQWFEDSRTRDQLNERITELEAEKAAAPIAQHAICDALINLGWTPPSQ